eukprot:CAMPEP_0167779828 /NCGR_PEP_ID=MMETSP0111_2-20121227/5019_1 /TAXON_ID=91324 /ORGANISM="Lotharella globosa, Strain CCCM811" /LENGTH=182 /DNA_ID=CAMNT_0007670273 /DNA_START=111 /DNA_END=659 /DNA_ORIENTATION=-
MQRTKPSDRKYPSRLRSAQTWPYPRQDPQYRSAAFQMPPVESNDYIRPSDASFMVSRSTSIGMLEVRPEHHASRASGLAPINMPPNSPQQRPPHVFIPQVVPMPHQPTHALPPRPLVYDYSYNRMAPQEVFMPVNKYAFAPEVVDQNDGMSVPQPPQPVMGHAYQMQTNFFQNTTDHQFQTP